MGEVQIDVHRISMFLFLASGMSWVGMVESRIEGGPVVASAFLVCYG